MNDVGDWTTEQNSYFILLQFNDLDVIIISFPLRLGLYSYLFFPLHFTKKDFHVFLVSCWNKNWCNQLDGKFHKNHNQEPGKQLTKSFLNFICISQSFRCK